MNDYNPRGGIRRFLPPGVSVMVCGIYVTGGVLLGVAAGIFIAQMNKTEADPVVAQYRGVKVHASEVFGPIKGHLSDLTEEMYRSKIQAINSLIERNLLAAESQKQKMSVPALIDKNAGGAVTKVTDAEIESFLGARGLNLNDPRIHKEDVRSYVLYLKHNDKKEAYVASLKKAANVKVTVVEPEIARINVDIDGYPTWGNANAPVTVVEFMDLDSPESAREVSVLSRVRSEYGPDKVKIVFRDLPVSAHPHSIEAALAAHCAGDQGKFWEYHDLVLTNQKTLKSSDFEKFADALKLDDSKFTKCVATKKYKALVDKSRTDGETLGIQSIPSFTINGAILEGALPFERFKEKIDRALSDMS